MAVISTTLVLEIVLRTIAPGFLVLFRLWRVVRIGHGLLVALEDAHHHKKLKVLELLNQAEEALDKGDIQAAKQNLHSARQQWEYKKEMQDDSEHQPPSAVTKEET